MISSPLAARRAASSRARSRRKARTPSLRVSCSGSRPSPGTRRWEEAKARGGHYLVLADRLDTAGVPSPVARPAPLVPAANQPRQLSVTAVETLLRDPYAIFARYVLRLDKLEPAGFAFDPRRQGVIWHEAFAAFVKQYPRALPPHPSEALIVIGRELLAPYMDDPQVAGFVWPRFQRVAHWFAEFERARRANIDEIAVETSSSLELSLADGETFRLTARPDRIERLRDGTLAVIDFKTGSPPRLAECFRASAHSSRSRRQS